MKYALFKPFRSGVAGALRAGPGRVACNADGIVAT
jgi:hypothetical protein